MQNKVHQDLIIAQQLAYEPRGLLCKNLVIEKESLEYGACNFEINNTLIQFRVAKITPTKIGQFVTFWKRVGTGPIMPYDMTDQFDFLVVSVRDGENFGQFIFSKFVLGQKGIISKKGEGGKRALRVYPPWNIAENKQAISTQSWQLKYFFAIKSNNFFDSVGIQKFFDFKSSGNI